MSYMTAARGFSPQLSYLKESTTESLLRAWRAAGPRTRALGPACVPGRERTEQKEVRLVHSPSNYRGVTAHPALTARLAISHRPLFPGSVASTRLPRASKGTHTVESAL